jgi:hypothetical protein
MEIMSQLQQEIKANLQSTFDISKIAAAFDSLVGVLGDQANEIKILQLQLKENENDWKTKAVLLERQNKYLNGKLEELKSAPPRIEPNLFDIAGAAPALSRIGSRATSRQDFSKTLAAAASPKPSRPSSGSSPRHIRTASDPADRQSPTQIPQIPEDDDSATSASDFPTEFPTANGDLEQNKNPAVASKPLAAIEESKTAPEEVKATTEDNAETPKANPDVTEESKSSPSGKESAVNSEVLESIDTFPGNSAGNDTAVEETKGNDEAVTAKGNDEATKKTEQNESPTSRRNSKASPRPRAGSVSTKPSSRRGSRADQAEAGSEVGSPASGRRSSKARNSSSEGKTSGKGSPKVKKARSGKSKGSLDIYAQRAARLKLVTPEKRALICRELRVRGDFIRALVTLTEGGNGRSQSNPGSAAPGSAAAAIDKRVMALQDEIRVVNARMDAQLKTSDMLVNEITDMRKRSTSDAGIIRDQKKMIAEVQSEVEALKDQMVQQLQMMEEKEDHQFMAQILSRQASHDSHDSMAKKSDASGPGGILSLTRRFEMLLARGDRDALSEVKGLHDALRQILYTSGFITSPTMSRQNSAMFDTGRGLSSRRGSGVPTSQRQNSTRQSKSVSRIGSMAPSRKTSGATAYTPSVPPLNGEGGSMGAPSSITDANSSSEGAPDGTHASAVDAALNAVSSNNSVEANPTKDSPNSLVDDSPPSPGNLSVDKSIKSMDSLDEIAEEVGLSEVVAQGDEVVDTELGVYQPPEEGFHAPILIQEMVDAITELKEQMSKTHDIIAKIGGDSVKRAELLNLVSVPAAPTARPTEQMGQKFRQGVLNAILSVDSDEASRVMHSLLGRKDSNSFAHLKQQIEKVMIANAETQEANKKVLDSFRRDFATFKMKLDQTEESTKEKLEDLETAMESKLATRGGPNNKRGSLGDIDPQSIKNLSESVRSITVEQSTAMAKVCTRS